MHGNMEIPKVGRAEEEKKADEKDEEEKLHGYLGI